MRLPIAILILASCINSQVHAGDQIEQTCGARFQYTEIAAPMGFGVDAATSMVDDIVNAVGLRRNFRVVATYDVSFAAAAIRPEPMSQALQRRHILFNPDWVESIRDDKWKAYAVLGHEVGHHLQGHTLDCQGSYHKIELEADEFSGYVLAKLGATEDEATRKVRTQSVTGSATHPPRNERVAATLRGYKRAKAESGEGYQLYVSRNVLLSTAPDQIDPNSPRIYVGSKIDVITKDAAPGYDEVEYDDGTKTYRGLLGQGQTFPIDPSVKCSFSPQPSNLVSLPMRRLLRDPLLVRNYGGQTSICGDLKPIPRDNLVWVLETAGFYSLIAVDTRLIPGFNNGLAVGWVLTVDLGPA